MRVRRLATLRAAQRPLHEVVDPAEFAEALAMGRKLLRRLQALSGRHSSTEIVDREQALRGVDDLLGRLSRRIGEVLLTADVPTLCASLAPLARQESGAIRALAAVALEADRRSQRILDLVEFLVALLSCGAADGPRTMARTPLEALPELGTVSEPAAYEAHPEIDEAGQIFGRAAARLHRDDPEATRDRVLEYKRHLGVRRLHPEVMAAAVSYDVAMANRLAALCGDHDTLDALIETVFGAEVGEPRASRRSAAARVVFQPPGRQARRSRLFWSSLATGGLSIGLVTLAVLLWRGPSVEVLAEGSASAISPHLVAGYVSGDDGTPHFVGTLGESWNALDAAERQLVVARIAARLEGDGVHDLTLVNAHRAVQARQEGDTLLWLMVPE